MEDNTCLPFPYKCQEFNSEEKAAVSKCFKSPFTDYVRVGPKGCVVMMDYLKEAPNIYNMPIRPDDIFVVSFQRSGTTWTQELVWLLANNLDYNAAATTPITRRYPFLEVFMIFSKKWQKSFIKSIQNEENKERAMAIVDVLSSPITDKLAGAPSPRFIKTHLPLSLLPPALLDTAKVVYVARDPRDVAVSFYHLCKLFKDLYQLVGTFKDFWNLFIKDLILYSPYFGNLKEAWEKRHHPNMLFLFYEELTQDLPRSVRRVADFLGKNLSTEELERLCDHLSIENFKKNKSLNFEELKEYGVTSSDESFIRKGKAGGWRNYFDEEMTEQAQRWITENLRDTDLHFPDT